MRLHKYRRCIMGSRIKDKKSRVLSDSERTRVRYLQPLDFKKGCGAECSLTPEKKADKTGHALTNPKVPGSQTSRDEAAPGRVYEHNLFGYCGCSSNGNAEGRLWE